MTLVFLLPSSSCDTQICNCSFSIIHSQGTLFTFFRHSSANYTNETRSFFNERIFGNHYLFMEANVFANSGFWLEYVNNTIVSGYWRDSIFNNYTNCIWTVPTSVIDGMASQCKATIGSYQTINFVQNQYLHSFKNSYLLVFSLFYFVQKNKGA